MWEFGGLWDEIGRRRKPYLQKQSLCIHENGEVLWLFKTEASVLMVEAKPKRPNCDQTPIGQVMLKRLLSAEQVIDRLCEEDVFQPHWHQALSSEADLPGQLPKQLSEHSPEPRISKHELAKDSFDENCEPRIAQVEKVEALN